MRQENGDPGDEDDGIDATLDRLVRDMRALTVDPNPISLRERLGLPPEPLEILLRPFLAGCCGQGVICFGDRHDFECPAGAE